MNNDRVIRIKRGDTLQLLCKLSNDVGAVEVLGDSYTIKMQIRKGVDKYLIWDFAENNGITKLSQLDDKGNNLLISATANQTAAMQPGRYSADIQISQGDETHTLPTAGEEPLIVEIEGDITK